MVLAVALLAVMDGLTKYVSNTFSFVQIFFFRSLFSLIPLIWYLRRTGQLRDLKTERKTRHLVRGILMLLATYCFIYAISYIPLGSMYAIQFSAPIFITILSVILLKEYVDLPRWGAIFLGFVGVLVIVQPGSDTFQFASLIALIGAITMAFATIQIRYLSTTESSGKIVFYFLLISIIATGSLLPFNWVGPTSFEWICLAGAGLVGGVGQIFFTMAFSQKNLGAVAPFSYFGILCAIIIGWVFWDEIPGNNVWVGGSIIISSGIFITIQEHRSLRKS